MSSSSSSVFVLTMIYISQVFSFHIFLSFFDFQFFKKNHIIHRNLTLGSVLGTRDAGTLLVKVSDFELAITGEQAANGKQTLSPFLIRWAAPEVLLSNKFSTKSDVRALGITFWEVLTDGTEPYEGLSNEEVVKQVTEYGFVLKQPENCPDSLYGIVKDLWKKQANDRPTFEDIKNRLLKEVKVVE
jgi:serine/threonine protein kinase